MSKKLKKIFILFLILTLSVISAVSVSFALADVQYSSINDIPSTQVYGTEYQIPKIKINVGGKEVVAKTLLYKPDGTAISGKTANLDQAGEYTLLFVANDNGVIKTQSKTFKVISPIVTFSSKGNTTQYYSDDVDSGLKISASSGTVATFSKIVDVSNLTKEDTLIRFKALPKFEGVNEMEKFEIKLTDIYDESNYLTFRIKSMSSSVDKQVYIDAAASNQVFSARNRVNNKSTLYKNSQFGYTCFANFCGQENLLGFGGKNAHSTPYFELRYDNEELAVYAHSPNSGLGKNDRERPYENIITFSSLDDFDTKWKGFTDGKVRISLKGTGTAANYIVTDLFGVELTDFTVDDTEEPLLTVETPEKIPAAVVNKEYTLFNANAYDVFSGAREVKTEVWFNYNGDTPISVAVIDGKFKTDKVGLYSIVYTAKDSYGNIAKKVIEVPCEMSVEQIVITLTGQYDNAQQGDIITFKEVNANGGSGHITTSVEITGGKYELTENGFIPYEVATYNVIYTATDYVGNSNSIEMPVVVSEQPNPVFVTELKMNEYLIDGYKYLLPQMKAIDYSDGAKELIANIAVTDKEGTRTLDGLEYIPSIRNNGDIVKIVFSASGKKGVSTIEKILTVIKPIDSQNKLALENFFISSSIAEVDYELKGIKFAFDKTTQMRFINPLIADQFTSEFRISNNVNLEYILTDKYDKNQILTLKFYNDGKNIIINANDSITYTSTFDVSNANNDLLVNINVKNKTLSFGGKTVVVENMPAFTSEYVYASWNISATDSEKTTILISKINGFSFVGLEQDGSAPQIVLYKEAVSAQKDSKVSTARAICSDVLNTYSTCYVKVLAPDGSIVKDENQILLDGTAPADKIYTFLCEQFGNYTVYYFMEDGLGNGLSTQYIIRVWDDQAPTISVSKIKDQKLNATITLPSATVEDNVTASNKCTVFITIRTPKGQTDTVLDDRKYQFTQKGEYEITYCAFDKNGNPAFYTYTINVK